MDDKLEEKLQNYIEKLLDEIKMNDEKRVLEYPADTPNKKGHHAFLKGINIENSFHPKVGDYNLLFESEYERIYIWTHTENHHSALISDIKPMVKEKDFWKTLGNIINLSLSYQTAFEYVHFEKSVEYKMIYYFLPSKSIQDLEFQNLSDFERSSLFNGSVIKATDIAAISQLIELMYRDDQLYTALSLLYSSFQIHHCCLICELGLSPVVKHKTHEPEL